MSKSASHTLYYSTLDLIPPSLAPFAEHRYYGTTAVFELRIVINPPERALAKGIMNRMAATAVEEPLLTYLPTDIPPGLKEHGLVYYGEDGVTPINFAVVVYPAVVVEAAQRAVESIERIIGVDAHSPKLGEAA